MKLHIASQGRGRRFGMLGVALLLTVAFGAPSAFASASSHKKKGLSLTNVSLLAGVNTAQTAYFAALKEGYFKKLGLNMTWFNGGAEGAAGEVTAYLSGAANFISVSVPALITATAAGAPIRVVSTVGDGNQTELAITDTAAAQYHVATTATSVAGIKAQLAALKGSHLVIAESGSTAASYVTAYAADTSVGLTTALGAGGTAADLYYDVVGSTTNEDTAYNAGKVQGVAGIPPVSVVPNAVTIQIGKIPPISESPGDYVATSTTMIQQHPDTVQAVVDGLTEGMSWIDTHPTAGEQLWNYYDSNFEQITSPEENEYLFAGVVSQWQTGTYPDKFGYNTLLKFTNLSQPPPAITLAYSTWIVPKFAAIAIKLPGLYKFKAA